MSHTYDNEDQVRLSIKTKAVNAHARQFLLPVQVTFRFLSTIALQFLDRSILIKFGTEIPCARKTTRFFGDASEVK